MRALASLIVLDKYAAQPVYLQIADQLLVLIKNGTIGPGYRLLSSRSLAIALAVHRKTVVRAYEDLTAQGWLQSVRGHGTYVNRQLPIPDSQSFSERPVLNADPNKKAGFALAPAEHLQRTVIKIDTAYHLDDGYPDLRLAPLQELSRAFQTQLRSNHAFGRLGYGDPQGSIRLREVLSDYLNETRGLKTTAGNILITRGTIMGLYLASTALLKPGDTVAVGASGWKAADTNFLQAGAKLVRIPVDEHGILTERLEEICAQQTLRMVYVTSHHHYPTTVALRADRRLALLRLSEKYRFIIFEDDYDYDFHYLNKPLMPLASADHAGMVLYCGSFNKSIAPGIRVGYLAGSENVIASLSLLRRIIDRQGDVVLENAMAELLQLGIIQRHLRKAIRTYRERRDLFCNLLTRHLEDKVSFMIPEGGLAVWTVFDPAIDLKKLAASALKNDIFLNDGSGQSISGAKAHALRLGFASSNAEELEHIVTTLRKII
ncbi:PLP-dependent aminotransferase family protein [Mucilaginibacter corticis]|uniref:PLP-dependent aminotransferase family protein n=1 Tax=Mucilaginibacter corticis TaxID=2597670 RepID=A0A556MII9_9SPHI|nr:PLP-dependent aminotransferase family protein [Mucilaginibacter corticis]TSJ39731.1 PLP-dependent aminotransferase family protein [Mucilaginibacter corticis]